MSLMAYVAPNQQPQVAPQAATLRQEPTNYNTSIAHNIPLQQLLSNRHHSASSCSLALAVQLALQQQQLHAHQQQQRQHQSHHPTPINQTQQSNNVTQQPPNTNQVPIPNFSSYNTAQNPLIVPATAPVAAHLNLSNNRHPAQPSNVVSSNALTNNNTFPVGHRPLATNTSLNSAANSSITNFRTAPQGPQQTHVQSNAPPQNQPSQHPSRPIDRTTLSEDNLSTFLNEQLRPPIFNQLFPNNQFAPPVAPLNSNRHDSSPTGAFYPAQEAVVQQRVSSSAVASQQPAQTCSQASVDNSPSELSHQQPGFQSVPQPPAQSRMTQASHPETYSNQAQSNVYLQQQQHALVNQQTSEPVARQQQQPQAPIPQLPLYPFPQQLEQALALLARPEMMASLYTAFNLYFQGGGYRADGHHTHHHHHPPHHYHHHMHGSHHHHHHHHGPHGQNNGQDDAMLTISESKPRGLNRAEIDSLTPYIQMNEKDPRTCVICLSRFELKSKIRPLPCNHAFHAKCVDKWLRANRTCPICRRDALKTHVAKIKRI